MGGNILLVLFSGVSNGGTAGALVVICLLIAIVLGLTRRRPN